MRYIINPPKLVKREILYRHIVVSILDDTEALIGAHEYHLDGKILPIATTDLTIPLPSEIRNKTEIETEFDLTEFTSNTITFNKHHGLNTKNREFWSFPTAEMAFTQKLIMLVRIREKILDGIHQDTKGLDKTIPESILSKIYEMKNQHPEYFL